MSEGQAIGTQAASTSTEPKPVESESQTEATKKNLNIRVIPGTFQKYTDLRTRLGLETNEQLLDRLMQESEQIPILRERLEAVALKAKASEQSVTRMKFKEYDRKLIAIPHILVPLIGKIRESLESQGFKCSLSTAMNFCILYVVAHTPYFYFDADELKLLDKFLREGPNTIDPEALNKFLNTRFALEVEPEAE